MFRRNPISETPRFGVDSPSSAEDDRRFGLAVPHHHTQGGPRELMFRRNFYSCQGSCCDVSTTSEEQVEARYLHGVMQNATHKYAMLKMANVDDVNDLDIEHSSLGVYG